MPSTLLFHLEKMFVSREENSLLDVRLYILLAVCVFGSFSVCARSAFRAVLFWKTKRRPRTPSGADVCNTKQKSNSVLHKTSKE